uniref:Uncharacterized protein n=1 Tax=Anopheles christyi TaxID=43041 RepID=A0A182JQW2_9DIPT
MSSVSIPKKSHLETKVLLRSSSFQKLCSIPYSFKIEGELKTNFLISAELLNILILYIFDLPPAIQSYKEHIKTVIKLLKIATRAYVISIYLKFMTTILFNQYIFKLCKQLKGYCEVAAGDYILESSKNVTPTSNVRRGIQQNVPRSQKPNILHLIIRYKTAVLTIMTYTCILYTALQIISLLTALWWSSDIPFGLLFLMLDLSYMGFIMSKV